MSDPDHTKAPEAGTGKHSDWPKMLEWIEKQAQDSLKARFVTAELIAKEAQTTLTVLLAGVGASAAYSVKVFEPGPTGPVAFASAAVCVYLMILSILLVTECMMFVSYPALYQDPKNITLPNEALDDVREVEVENIGERITEAKAINDGRASRLNKVRIYAALSPLVFAVFALAAPAKPPSKVAGLKFSCSIATAASSPSSTASIDCELKQPSPLVLGQ